MSANYILAYDIFFSQQRKESTRLLTLWLLKFIIMLEYAHDISDKALFCFLKYKEFLIVKSFGFIHQFTRSENTTKEITKDKISLIIFQI